MISRIANLSFVPKYGILNNKKKQNSNSQVTVTSPIKTDSINFTGKSSPSMYSTVFEYLTAEIFGKNKKFGVDGSFLSASKIKEAVKNVFDSERAFPDYKNSSATKIKWKTYIPQDIRVYSIDKINEARADRFGKWKKCLENPSANIKNKDLARKLEKDKSLRLVVWDAITSEIKENNRHIPVPLNENALLETVKDFEKIEPISRAVRCAKPSFLDVYTHRLRDNLLMKMGKSDEKAVWVKIPSKKHDIAHFEQNIENLETLSCRNWCTRSSVDKAREALEEGDFYIYLKRNSISICEPVVVITTYKGKIDQIQGIENNNIVPLNLVGEIKTFIKSNNLKCQSGLSDEYPMATQSIMISEKLNEVLPDIQKSFAKSIKDNDSISMFKYLGVNAKQDSKDGLLTIGTYKPSYSLDKNSGISIPYSMFGFNEDDLLKNVKIIDGNLILSNPKNKLFNSLISKMPEHLEKVTGRIECNAEQYEKFGADFERISDGKVIVHK